MRQCEHDIGTVHDHQGRKLLTAVLKQNPKIRGVITMRRAHKWAQNVLNLRLKVISFAIMTPSEQFNVS